MQQLEEQLKTCAALHAHLCPRQVLGVRMGILAGELLGIELPQPAKRLLTIVETDGCIADGVAVTTNCWIGRRTLRVEDYGKVAATFVDTQTRAGLRIVPRSEARQRARLYATDAPDRWHAYLLGYQRMPADELFTVQSVELCQSIEQIVSRPDKQEVCEHCVEEIINGREIVRIGVILCRSCAGPGYYRSSAPGAKLAPPIGVAPSICG